MSTEVSPLLNEYSKFVLFEDAAKSLTINKDTFKTKEFEVIDK